MDLQSQCIEGGLTWRRFCVLLRGLPPESAYAAWLRDRSNRALVDTGMPGRVI